MSVAVATVKDGKVWIAGDSLVSDGDEAFEAVLSPKAFVWEDLVFGVVGDARVCDLVYASFEPPECTEDTPHYRYMVDDLVESLRDLLYERDITHHADGTERDPLPEFELLVGFRGVLYVIDNDFAVTVPSDQTFAIGSGSGPARASLHQTKADKDPRARLRKAVQAAIRTRIDCGGRIVIVSN